MDSQTHVELADKLLGLTGAPVNLSLLSLFPQIDRFPHTLHRVYAHTVFKARTLSGIGLRVLADDSYSDEAHAFDVQRFREEKPRFLSYLSKQGWDVPVLDVAHFESAMMSYISHVYLDTYNQPAQPFAPYSIYCSGQWQLWEKIGDFRQKLYLTPVIGELRSELFALPLWQQAPAVSPAAFIQAMMVRMCRLSLDKIDEQVIPLAMRSLALEPLPASALAEPLAFLETFEAHLNRLHLKHLAPGAQVTVLQNFTTQPEQQAARVAA